MTAALLQRTSGCNSGVKSLSKRACARRTVRVFSAPPERKISRTDVRYTGFQEQDSYGLTNIYPVEVKTYEAGSASDTQDTFNTPLAGAAFVIAAAVISAGLIVLGGSSSPTAGTTEDLAQYESLSQYQAKFKAELGISTKPAPAVVAVSQEPEVVAAVDAAVDAALSE